MLALLFGTERVSESMCTQKNARRSVEYLEGRAEVELLFSIVLRRNLIYDLHRRMSMMAVVFTPLYDNTMQIHFYDI